jgi:hypothetical protein
MGQAGGTGRRGDSKEDDVAIVVLPNVIFTKAETAGEVRKARKGEEPCAQTTAVSQPRKTEESEEEVEAEEVSYVSLGLSTSTSGIMAVATQVRFPVRVLFDAVGMLGDLWRRTQLRRWQFVIPPHLDLQFYLHLPMIVTIPPLRVV